MRILYFPKLIKDEESKPCFLRDCTVVIDGQNFFYSSYEASKLPYVFGSEANEHAKYIRKILKMFKHANVKCYIVFKGGNVDINKKIQSIKPMNFDFDSNYQYVSPVFLKEVCKQVLDEAKVNYATCITESKEECVALAQKLGCPVLSNDISFCFKNAPYIPSTTVEFQWKQKRISCKQYNFENFLDKHSLTEKKVAIFAALSDITVFPQNHFNGLLQTWDVFDKNYYVQNKKLLKWLSVNSENEILVSVAEFLSNENDKKCFLEHIEDTLRSMRNDQCGVVSKYLYNDCKLQVSQSDPLWFEKGVATQKIAIHYINLFKHKFIQGSWAIENNDICDSLMVSIDIIKYAYNLITNFQPCEISVYNQAKNFIKVHTDLQIKKPSYTCTESVFENGWNNIKSLKLFEHFLTENGINTVAINKFPAEARMLFIALIYFSRKKAAENINVRKQVYCFIISYVLLHVVSDSEASFRKKNSKITEQDSEEAMKATKEYFKCGKIEAMQIFDGDELKILVELQYCLVHMNYLNALCGSPYNVTKYHRTFNGTLVYKLFHDMKHSNNENFIESLFIKAPSVLNFIINLITTFKEF